MTIPCDSNDLPTWNHSFLFSTDDASTIFSHNSALVLEFYPAATGNVLDSENSPVENHSSFFLQSSGGGVQADFDFRVFLTLTLRGTFIFHPKHPNEGLK